jgi:ankyrin repeat protein
MWAAKDGRDEALSMLLNAGAEPNAGMTRDGYTSLMWAAQNGQLA